MPTTLSVGYLSPLEDLDLLDMSVDAQASLVQTDCFSLTHEGRFLSLETDDPPLNTVDWLEPTPPQSPDPPSVCLPDASIDDWCSAAPPSVDENYTDGPAPLLLSPHLPPPYSLMTPYPSYHSDDKYDGVSPAILASPWLPISNTGALPLQVQHSSRWSGRERPTFRPHISVYSPPPVPPPFLRHVGFLAEPLSTPGGNLSVQSLPCYPQASSLLMKGPRPWESISVCGVDDDVVTVQDVLSGLYSTIRNAPAEVKYALPTIQDAFPHGLAPKDSLLELRTGERGKLMTLRTQQANKVTIRLKVRI